MGEKKTLTRAEMASLMGISEDEFIKEIESAGKRDPMPMNRAQRRAIERAMRRKG